MRNRRVAQVTLVSSVTLLVLAALLGVTMASESPRSDLVGEASSADSAKSDPANALTMPVRESNLLSEPDADATSSPATPSPTRSSPVTAETKAKTEPARAPSKSQSAQPLRLEMPSIGVDSGIVPVAKNDDGSMELPGATEAGWYEPGPNVGGLFGSSVIAAHVDFNGVRGVFFDLRKVEIGNEIIVTDVNGVRRSYTVTERFQVNKEALQIPELFRTTGPHVLTLITCGGAFDTGERRYDDNIVIRAVPSQA